MLALCLLPQRLPAQASEFNIPPNTILPNYNRVVLGQREALEGGAYVARTDDAVANWYNPAGLALSEKTSLNASSNAYELTTTKLGGLGQEISSTRVSPVGGFVGIVVGAPIAKSPRLRFGFGITRPVAWSPSTLRGAFSFPAGAGVEAFTYSSSVNFWTVTPSINGAYRLSPTVRVGLGIGYALTNLTQDQAVTDRVVLPNGVTTGLRSFSTDGNAHHLLFSAGAQWDIARAVTLGALVVSPGVRLGGGSSISFSQTRYDAAGASNDLAFGDPNAKLDYRLPFRVVAGAAVKYSRGQVEVDVRYFGAEDTYGLLSSDSTAVQITTDAAGVPTVTNPAFTPVLNTARSVVSVAVGGNYSVSRAIRVHVGFFTDPSPVSDPPQSTFRAVDLTGVSGGISLGAGRLTGSFGVASSWGTTTERQVGPSIGGAEATTDVTIRTFTGLYSVSFTF
ncbi:MAG TPA: hypothetical protein VJQ44_06005 [Gemmatimonadales bacterium]|nr:hypothetical protein [Gemmatimonadales bacterium]